MALSNKTQTIIKTALCCAALVTMTSAKVLAADDFGGASPGSSQILNPDEVAQKVDQAKAELKTQTKDACHGSTQCEYFTLHSDNKGFNLTVYAGKGLMNNYGYGYGSGTNYYIGGTNQTTTNGQISYGVQLTYKNMNCSTTVFVDESLYNVITTYTNSMINTTPGEPKVFADFTPAQQQMIALSKSIMELAKGNSLTCN